LRRSSKRKEHAIDGTITENTQKITEKEKEEEDCSTGQFILAKHSGRLKEEAKYSRYEEN
jgi:hypothetical protein